MYYGVASEDYFASRGLGDIEGETVAGVVTDFIIVGCVSNFFDVGYEGW